jgi:hypothetical protein
MIGTILHLYKEPAMIGADTFVTTPFGYICRLLCSFSEQLQATFFCWLLVLQHEIQIKTSVNWPSFPTCDSHH